MANIYVASSWSNPIQPYIVKLLRIAGHEVYDFREHSFRWMDLDYRWKDWSNQQYLDALHDPIADKGFGEDWIGMHKADTCIMLLPCGRSSHLEAGYFVGAKKRLFILLEQGKVMPELMYKMATLVTDNFNSVMELL